MTTAADRILAAVREIPHGQVASYGEIATRAGLPRRARLVARVLSHNDDAALPWHRVVRADGCIALERDSAAFNEQCGRLRAEGLTVDNGRVRRQRREPDLDQQVWGPAD
ncbi:MGMT family protein [Lysobacter korlensis]|uniref:MGMT family protein n=1 Tax=Lysobacter korlensis TaxID=553636 RepID=A0ABV6RPQ8_9GAMM